MRVSFFFLFLGLFGMESGLKAAILEPNLELAVPFYKEMNSLFPSGQKRREDLLQSSLGSVTDFHYRALWGEKTLEIQAHQMIRELDVTVKASLKKKVPLLRLPDISESPLTQLLPEQDVEIENLRGLWARIKVNDFQKGYVLITDLETRDQDLGAWVSLSDLSLKKFASHEAPQAVQIPKLTRLQLVTLEKDFALVRTKTQSGYAPLSALLGRVDFANLAWNQKLKKWERVLYRMGRNVIIEGGQKRDLLDFSAFQPVKNRAFVSAPHPQASRGARIELLESVAQKWTQSYVKDHGVIWWKTDLFDKNPSGKPISTADLLKRRITAISYDSKTKKGLASANGIYRTLDGKRWTKIPSFGSEDWPVCLHPDGVWFVGPYRSTDEGSTFRPTIKWSELARTLQGEKNKAFSHFRVVDLKALKDGKIMMKVDTGISLAKIQAPLLSDQWTVVK